MGFTPAIAANPNLQLHSATDWIVNIPASRDGGAAGIANFGKTFRLGFTNTTTGATLNDGLLMRMSGNDFFIDNQENKNINFFTGTFGMSLNGTTNRINFGTLVLNPASNPNSVLNGGLLNLLTPDNGIFVNTTAAAKFGISFRSNSLTDNAIQVMGTTGTTRNFAVKANGEVFARKYTTTLANIPDYVFAADYKLMSLIDLRKFIGKNKHLPNIPSAIEFEKTGVDLGELNRLLLEKLEEHTLYILQLEERLQKLEDAKH